MAKLIFCVDIYIILKDLDLDLNLYLSYESSPYFGLLGLAGKQNIAHF